MTTESESCVSHYALDVMPKGWTSATIGQIVELNPPKPRLGEFDDDLLVSFVPMPAVDSEIGAITLPEERHFGEVRKGYTAFRDNDVLLAKITPCMENGKAAIARHLTNGLGFGSTEFHVLRPTDSVIPEYIYYFIRQESFRRHAEAEMTGSVGQKRVPPAFLEDTDIALPPLAEQKRIVAKVEELLARVNAAREHLDRVPKIMKRFRQSVLAAACSGKLTEGWREKMPEPESSGAFAVNSRCTLTKRRPSAANGVELPELPHQWAWVSIEQVASGLPRSIQSGPFGSNLLHSEFQETGILAIGIDNVLEGSFSLGKQHRISESKCRELEKYAARPLDVLVTVMGTVGRCCVVPADIETAIITKHVYRITADTDTIEPWYLMRALQGDVAVNEQIQRRIIGQTRPGINGQILKAVLVPVPPMTEQREIIRRVDALFNLADGIEKRVATARVRADKLTQSILAKAFRGELVPTEAELARREGRDYEPASVLLERIRAKREKEKSPYKKTRKRR